MTLIQSIRVFRSATKFGLVGWIIGFIIFLTETGLSDAVINYRLSQPQIYVEDGNVYFIPAQHKNLILSSTGTGKILFNNLELDNLLASVQNSTRDLESIKQVFRAPSSGSSSTTRFAERLAQIEQTVNRLGQVESLEGRLTSLERQVLSGSTNGSSTPGSELPSSFTSRSISRRLRQLTNRVRNLEQRISPNRNPCRSSPCSNGGTCLPTAFGAFCLCPDGWEGDRCDIDKNECSAFAGTDLGCKNGGLCVNTPGSFHCQCLAGWFGLHCTIRTGDCSSASSYELCGHGTCVSQSVGPRPYTCICDQGWKTDGNSPACNVDIDECNGPHPSCSKNPLVICINTPGSFHCGPCPYGYSGNGYYCTDVDECLVNNGGCSTNPMVQCINSIGSRTCAECPPGYAGNGVSCQYVGICQVNNGGCYPLARCIENPVIGQSFVQCVCPAGYAGTGMGPNGCIQDGSGTDVGPTNACSTNPCLNNGICASVGSTFRCTCVIGFTGQTCEARVNSCLSGPCLNGGTCRQSTANPGGYVCECGGSFTGMNCERQEEQCGGVLNGLEGTFSYPHDSSTTYRHNANCMWRLYTTLGKVVNITFTRFHLEGSATCNYDWLQINDGRESSSPLIGRYCGEQLPNGGNITTTHEVVHFWFHSDQSTTGLGFAFNWTSSEPVCGGTITGQSYGTVSSPGYPGNYPHSRDCLWTVSVSLAKRVQLVFAALQIEVHSNCSFDYLEIRDGREENSHVLGYYCNSTLPEPITSSGPYVTIRFHSDESNSDIGFHVTFTEIPGVPGCGGVFTDGIGAITSPAHPEPYAHGLDCEYLIRLPSPEERVQLTFISFELEAAANCTFDHVEIYDGNSPDSPLLGRFCERNIPPPIRSSTNALYILFRSDVSISFGGFNARYEAVCGGIFANPEGILRSPFYPANYPRNRDCTYIISQPTKKAIQLQFIDFDIEGSPGPRCIWDFLEIRDGDNENSTLIGHFCGGPQSKPEPIISTYNYLWIRFKTDGSQQNKGFLANYSTIDTSCGGILKDSHGALSSPGYPDVYPHGVRCTWIISGQPGQIVQLNWVSFSLERNPRCRHDAVEIYDNSTMFPNGTLVGRFCGHDLPPVITSSDNIITVIFESDHSVSHDGFLANYVLVNASKVCGGNYFTEFGVVKSPGFPNKYPNGKSCSWTITVPAGKQIMLNITDFNLENATTRGCVYDYLEIRNGGQSTSPLIGTFCGNNPPPSTIPSFSHTMFLKFVADSSQAGTGFQIFWDGTTTGCGGELSAPTGSIVSPGYPLSAVARTECFWTIKVSKGSAIQFVFADLDLGRSQDCGREYVELRDGSKANSPLIGKYCSAESLLAINTTDNALRVKSVSSYWSSGRGFHANYQTICSRTLRGFHGVIESPAFPRPYPHHRNCTWNIEAPLGNKLNLSFSHFAVEEPFRNNCRYDFVEVGERDAREAAEVTILGKYCGSLIPTMIPTTKQVAIVKFVSDISRSSNGFRMEWVVNGCGGKIQSSFAVVKSPNYPRHYNNNVVCEWEVATRLGSRARLDIYQLDIEAGNNCQWDYLKIYGGPNDNSPLLTQLCHRTDKTVSVLSRGNAMFIRFKSDWIVSGKGFYGYIGEDPAGCGGFLNAPTGFIYSPNFPNNYDADDDCSWVITVDQNHVVELTFMEFDVESHINCSYDHVAIYDGYSMYDPLLLMACGNSVPTPPTVKSTGNQMLVRFKADGTNFARGFKLNYTIGCGATIVSYNGGEIKTPNFPHLTNRLNCTWFIRGPQPDDLVSLTFTHMDIHSYGAPESQSDTCERNYVEVFDGEDLDAPSVGKYCLSRVPPTITSRGNGLVVYANTTYAYGSGFRAIYSVASSACGGTYTSSEGTFTTPGYPSGYTPNAECIWILKASAGNRVSLSFRSFDIEASDFCNTDYVEIHENDAAGALIGHFCGNEVPTNLTAEQKLWILFRSDGEGQAPGFMADYSLVHGNELRGSSGVIQSPLYPMDFFLNDSFTWRIFVNESQAIQITFNEFVVGYQLQSNTDFMKIFDGYDDTAPELLKHSGEGVPEQVISTGNVVYIILSKKYRTKSIFSLSWQEVPVPELNIAALSRNITGCGGNFPVGEGNITTLLSPNYPNSYPLNMRCEWLLNSVANHRIQLKVEDLDLEAHSSCLYDRLEVYDGESGLANYVLNKTMCLRSENGTSLMSSGRTMKVVFISDHSFSRSGFNLSLSAVCGGFVRDLRGKLTTPNYPRNYVNSICEWVIIARPGRTIQLAFETFDIYSGGGGTCSSDQLIVRNGGNTDAPFLGQGRLCGSTIPILPESSSNQIYLRFSALTSGGRGFSLVYNEVSIGCGGQIHLTNDARDFEFSSPNYPHIPPPFTECEWVFTAPQGEAVQLDFQLTFQLTASWPCTMEGVELRDGGTRLAPLVNTFCHDMPSTQKVTGNAMYVRYFTTISEPQPGFKAKASIASCGGTMVGWSGSIESPGYSRTYDENIDCEWTVRVRESSYVILYFAWNSRIGSNAFETTNVTNCTEDWIKITEANITGIDEPRTWSFCGLSSLPSVETSMNQVHIFFHSDSVRNENSKFRIFYRTSTDSCGGVMSTPTGYIQSINYPNPYPHYRSCYWRIIAPEGRRVRIEFLDFDLVQGTQRLGSMYCSDRVTIRPSYYSNGLMYNRSLCGSALPEPVESTAGSLTVYFHTFGTVTHRGFKLKYTTDLPLACGGEISGVEGRLASPTELTGTPNTTTSYLCEWKHPGNSENATTVITVHDAKIPPWGTATSDPYCVSGFLLITDDKSFSTWQFKRLCGVITNEKLYIPGDSFKINYEVNHAESSFNLTYQVISCGDTLRGPNDTISSPGYPSSYPTNTECIWLLKYPSRYFQISITFTALNIDDHQSSDGCDRDYVLIRNGGYANSPIMGKYCGTNMPSTFNAMSNSLWIEFHSDENSDGSRHGFQIETTSVEHGCGGVVHSKLGSIKSPRTSSGSSAASSRYPNNVECEWIIETVPGYTVNIIFDQRFDIEISPNCSNDYLEFFTRYQSEWTSLGRYCGKQLPGSINTTSTSVKVKFHSNEAVDGAGFFLYWYSPCGGIFTEQEGVIRSAHYDRLSHSAHVDSGLFWSWRGWESTYEVARCDYVIQGSSETDYIVAEFVPPFEVTVPAGYYSPDAVSQDNTCPDVNVTIWEGNSTTPTWNTRTGGLHCGQELPTVFVAKGALTISYNYKAAYHNDGWKVRYSTYKCGGEISMPSSVQSPGHPFTSAPNMNCTWIVRAPEGKIVRFRFEKLELEYSPSCYYDSVKLFNGDHIDENERIGTFCGNMTDEITRINSKSNIMTIQFLTDVSREYGGFSAATDFTIGETNGCGGTINTTNGVQTIRSPDSDNDGKYDTFLDCHWLVVGPDFQMIALTFSSFTLEGQGARGRGGNESCPYDYIEIYDGPGPSGALLGRFCGSNRPPGLASSTNFMWIRFVTDGAYEFTGFQATVASRPSPCGTSFVFNATSTSQILTSPAYPDNYPNTLRCKWTIDGARFNDELDIRFVDLQIESSPDCSKDRLEIRDVPSSYNNPEGIAGPILFNGNRLVDWRFRYLSIDTETIMQNVMYCGSQLPPDFFSVSRSAEIVFITDSTNSAAGFKLEYRAASCNRTFENSHGRIFSPEYPTFTPIYTNCVMMIKANNGSTISMYFNQFDLPDSVDCTNGFFEVRETNRDGQLLGKYCGSVIPNPVFSQTNILWISFLTRGRMSRGFDISYTTTSEGSGCGGELFHTFGSFSSPSYPGNYSRESDCRWKVRVPAGLKIQLTFTSFMLATGDCTLNFVELFSMNSHDMTSAPVLYTRFCSGDTPAPYQGGTDMAVVRYKSSVNNTGNGWRAEFKGILPT